MKIKLLIKKLSGRILVCLGVCFLSTPAMAQLLPPNQPEQDACDALQLCGNQFTTPFSYQGEGDGIDLFGTPCGGGEAESMWIRLEVTDPGSIVFSIAPLSVNDDYDFAVVDITEVGCDNMTGTNVVACNFNNNSPGSNVDGIVGVNSTSTIAFVGSGSFGNSFCQQIDAAAGDIYLIMVNNFGNYVTGGISSGFTIDFTGSTAQFFDNTPPVLDSIATAAPCSYRNEVTVYLNTQISCASLATDGSDFTLSPGGTISAASGLNCTGSEGYTDQLTLTFDPPLMPGAYTLNGAVGSDGNSLLNLCATELALPQSLAFEVLPMAEFQTASIACKQITLQLTAPVECNTVASNGSDFMISGPGGPVVVTGAQAVDCINNYTQVITINIQDPLAADGNYTLNLQEGIDGNTLIDSCGVLMTVGDTISFFGRTPPLLSLPDSIITCVNTGIQLPLTIENVNSDINYSYIWTPTVGLSDPNIAQPLANPVTDQVYEVIVSGSHPSMCAATADIYVHTLPGFTINTPDTTICEGASVILNVTGSDEYSYTWSPTTGVSDTSIRNPVISPTTTTTYYLTATYPGCIDSMADIKITVEPNPATMTVSPDVFMCAYDTALMSVTAYPVGFDFTYSWSPAGQLLYDNEPNTAYFGDTSGSFIVTVSTPIGCTASDTINVTVWPGDFSGVLFTDTGYCPGNQVQLGAYGGLSYSWSPAYGLSDSTVADPIAAPLTSTTYTVVATSNKGCLDSQQVHVEVYPDAVVYLPDSVTVYPGEAYQISPGGNCLYFAWFPPSGLSADNIASPLADPEVRTRYFVQASTEHGCTIEDSLDVLVVETAIDMPNAFNPSGNANPVFKASKRGIAELSYFRIFNRWGQVVFETSDVDKGWDGTYKDAPQPMGVYVYAIEGITVEGKIFSKEGTVTLIR